MASIVTLGCMEELEASLIIPLGLTRLLIHDMKVDSETTKSFLQGRIKSICGLVKHAKASMFYRKVTIEEDETRDQMHFMLTVEERSAEQLRFLKEESLALGDLLVVVNVKIELDPLFPSYGGANVCQALVNLSSANCRVLLVKTSHDSSCRSNKHQEKISPASTVVNRIVSNPKGQKLYTYVKIADLAATKIVNVFGVVRFVRDPSKTRGADYSTLITLVDESANDSTDKLKCVLFGTISNLPSAKQGDIIRFHRLKITNFRNELQGQISPGFAWVVFNGSVDAPLSPISTSHQNNTITEEDQERVRQLRLWTASEMGVITQDGRKLCSLSEITTGQFFDLICQVVGTCVLTEGESLLLKVWDGTRVKLKLHEQDLTFENIASRLKLQDQLADRARHYLVDVWVYDDHFGKAMEVMPGDFIKFQNLHAMQHKFSPEEEAGSDSLSVELCLHHGFSYGRRLTILDPMSKEVNELRQLLDRELAAAADDSADSIDQLLSEAWVAPLGVDLAVNVNGSIPNENIERSSNVDDLGEFFTPFSRPQSVQSSKQYNAEVNAPLVNNVGGSGAVTCAQLHAIVGSEQSALKRTGAVSDEVAVKCVRHDISAGNECDIAPRRKEQASGSDIDNAVLSLQEGTVSSSEHTVAVSQDEILLSLENDLIQNGQTESVENEAAAVAVPNSPSLGFTRNRCMLNTATVMTGHHHIKVTEVINILTHMHPGKFRFQGYALKYRPRSETAAGFLQLFCNSCGYWSPIPGSDTGDECESSELSENFSAPILKGIEDEIEVYCCPMCDGVLEYIYMVEFILSDGTGQIDVGLFRQHANHFFDCSPTDLLRNPNRYREIMEKLNHMCFGQCVIKDVVAVDLSSHDPQKMECCLMSYHTADGISYQMFDTTFAVDF